MIVSPLRVIEPAKQDHDVQHVGYQSWTPDNLCILSEHNDITVMKIKNKPVNANG